MEKVKVPEGYQQVMPYLIVDGASDFIQFTARVFQATEKLREMRDEKRIMHAEIQIGDNVIMLADSTKQFSSTVISLFIYVEDADVTYQKAVREGAVSIQEPADQSYGRSCGIRDPFGNIWWITSVQE